MYFSVSGTSVQQSLFCRCETHTEMLKQFAQLHQVILELRWAAPLQTLAHIPSIITFFRQLFCSQNSTIRTSSAKLWKKFMLPTGPLQDTACSTHQLKAICLGWCFRTFCNKKQVVQNKFTTETRPTEREAQSRASNYSSVFWSCNRKWKC